MPTPRRGVFSGMGEIPISRMEAQQEKQVLRVWSKCLHPVRGPVTGTRHKLAVSAQEQDWRQEGQGERKG